MTSKHHKNRLAQAERFFEGKLSPGEAQEFLSWFNTLDGEEELFLEIHRVWTGSTKNKHVKEWDGTDLFAKIQQTKENHHQFHPGKEENQVTGKLSTKRSRIGRMRQVAAAIGLVIASAVLIVRFTAQNEVEIAEKVPQPILKSNPSGQKSKIHLPDGSVVFLNAESSLSFYDNFSTHRHIELVGEAFFEVASDTINPFTVKAGALTTTALGTSFNIRSFGNEKKTEVALIEGKVSISKQETNETILLSPGEKATVEGRSFNTSQADLTETYWKDGIIHLNETPFENVITILERWYGVDIKVTGNANDFRCTGTFKNLSLTKVLESLSYTAGFHYETLGKEVQINLKEQNSNQMHTN